MGKKKGAGEPSGKMNAYACFMQTCRKEHKLANPDDSVDFKAFSKKCSEKWRSMSTDQKKPFDTKAKEDKVRYEKDMALWRKTNPEAAAEKGGKRKKKDKDPNEPKRALSAFFHFCNEFRPRVLAELQGDAPTKPSVGEVAKELGARWKKMTEDKMEPYKRLHEKDKARYEKEMAAYKARGGAGGSPAKKAKKVPVKEVSEEEDDDEESEEESEEESD